MSQREKSHPSMISKVSKNLDGLVFKNFRGGVKFGIFEFQYLTPNYGVKIRKNEID